jgi:DNA-binding transcriptional LysR family regulator
MVDTRLLSGVEVLVAVIETGSFVRAVEALGLSHSTRSLRFIDEGGRFYAESAALLVQLSDAALALTGARQAVCGRLRVEVDPFFSRLVLAPRLDTNWRRADWHVRSVRRRKPAVRSAFSD